MMTIEGIIESARGREAGRIAIAAAHDEDVIMAAIGANRAGIAVPVLIGDSNTIEEILNRHGEEVQRYRIIHAADPCECARIATETVSSGDADFLMKGALGTADLLRAVLDKNVGLRTDRLLSHVMLYQVNSYPKLLALTDGGMNTFPDLVRKADILENAAILMKALGYQSITAACICGAETVDPKIQSTIDAAALSDMRDRWLPYSMTVLGPVGLDLAISMEACRHKGYKAEGGGSADILLVPSYEVGNGIGKALSYFAHAQSAGLVVGAKVPIVLVSRADTAQTKLASIALGAVVARSMGKFSELKGPSIQGAV
jgi:phosphate butyryltransferase